MLQQRTLDDADSSFSSAANRQLDALSSKKAPWCNGLSGTNKVGCDLNELIVHKEKRREFARKILPRLLADIGLRHSSKRYVT